jgi:hypothetical protein
MKKSQGSSLLLVGLVVLQPATLAQRQAATNKPSPIVSDDDIKMLRSEVASVIPLVK